MKAKRIERGWAGHFVDAHNCNFRRNTLLESGEIRIVVSTVGGWNTSGFVEGYRELGKEMFYETSAFPARAWGSYWVADHAFEIPIRAPSTIDKMSKDSNLLADEMHEMVVEEFLERIDAGEFEEE